MTTVAPAELDPAARAGAAAGFAGETDDEVSLLDLALVIAQNLRLLILGPLAAGLLALGVAFLIPPEFAATTRLMPPAGGGTSAALASALGALGGMAGSLGGLAKTPADQTVGLLKSRTLADRIVERFDLRKRYDQETLEQTRKELESRTVVSSQPKEGFVTVTVEDRDPKVAAEIANAYVEELRRLMRTIAITEAGQRRLFFEEQLKASRDALDRAELALKSSGLGETALKLAPQAMFEQAARLKAQIAAQEIRIASMRGFVADGNPDLRQAQQELASMRAQWSDLRKQGAEEDSPPASTPAASYAKKYREFKYQETLFELMAKQYELARLDEARDGSVIQVVDDAVAPERKVKPKKAMIALITSLATGFALLLLVFLRRALHSTSATPEGAEKLRHLRQAFRSN